MRTLAVVGAMPLLLAGTGALDGDDFVQAVRKVGQYLRDVVNLYR